MLLWFLPAYSSILDWNRIWFYILSWLIFTVLFHAWNCIEMSTITITSSRLAFSYLSEYRFDVSKLEPLVAKVSASISDELPITPLLLLFTKVYLVKVAFISIFTVFFFSRVCLCTMEWSVKSILQPHSPDNRALARECKDVKIDRVYIGSCTGGKTEDFLAAAKVFLASVRVIHSHYLSIELTLLRSLCTIKKLSCGW